MTIPGYLRRESRSRQYRHSLVLSSGDFGVESAIENKPSPNSNLSDQADKVGKSKGIVGGKVPKGLTTTVRSTTAKSHNDITTQQLPLATVKRILGLKYRGNTEYRIGKYHQASAYYSECINMHRKHGQLVVTPCLYRLYSNRAMTALALATRDVSRAPACAQWALEDAEACIRLKPDFPKGIHMKALALGRLGRYDEAISFINEMKNRITDTDAVYVLGCLKASLREDSILTLSIKTNHAHPPPLESTTPEEDRQEKGPTSNSNSTILSKTFPYGSPPALVSGSESDSSVEPSSSSEDENTSETRKSVVLSEKIGPKVPGIFNPTVPVKTDPIIPVKTNPIVPVIFNLTVPIKIDPRVPVKTNPTVPVKRGPVVGKGAESQIKKGPSTHSTFFVNPPPTVKSVLDIKRVRRPLYSGEPEQVDIMSFTARSLTAKTTVKLTKNFIGNGSGDLNLLIDLLVEEHYGIEYAPCGPGPSRRRPTLTTLIMMFFKDSRPAISGNAVEYFRLARFYFKVALGHGWGSPAMKLVLQEAMSYYQLTASLCENSLIHLELSLMYLILGDYRSTHDSANMALCMDPRNIRSYLRLATLDKLRGNLVSASDILKQGRANCGHHPRLVWNLGKVTGLLKVFPHTYPLAPAMVNLAKTIPKSTSGSSIDCYQPTYTSRLVESRLRWPKAPKPTILKDSNEGICGSISRIPLPPSSLCKGKVVVVADKSIITNTTTTATTNGKLPLPLLSEMASTIPKPKNSNNSNSTISLPPIRKDKDVVADQGITTNATTNMKVTPVLPPLESSNEDFFSANESDDDVGPSSSITLPSEDKSLHVVEQNQVPSRNINGINETRNLGQIIARENASTDTKRGLKPNASTINIKEIPTFVDTPIRPEENDSVVEATLLGLCPAAIVLGANYTCPGGCTQVWSNKPHRRVDCTYKCHIWYHPLCFTKVVCALGFTVSLVEKEDIHCVTPDCKGIIDSITHVSSTTTVISRNKKDRKGRHPKVREPKKKTIKDSKPKKAPGSDVVEANLMSTRVATTTMTTTTIPLPAMETATIVIESKEEKKECDVAEVDKKEANSNVVQQPSRSLLYDATLVESNKLVQLKKKTDDESLFESTTGPKKKKKNKNKVVKSNMEEVKLLLTQGPAIVEEDVDVQIIDPMKYKHGRPTRVLLLGRIPTAGGVETLIKCISAKCPEANYQNVITQDDVDSGNADLCNYTGLLVQFPHKKICLDVYYFLGARPVSGPQLRLLHLEEKAWDDIMEQNAMLLEASQNASPSLSLASISTANTSLEYLEFTPSTEPGLLPSPKTYITTTTTPTALDSRVGEKSGSMVRTVVHTNFVGKLLKDSVRQQNCATTQAKVLVQDIIEQGDTIETKPESSITPSPGLKVEGDNENLKIVASILSTQSQPQPDLPVKAKAEPHSLVQTQDDHEISFFGSITSDRAREYVNTTLLGYPAVPPLGPSTSNVDSVQSPAPSLVSNPIIDKSTTSLKCQSTVVSVSSADNDNNFLSRSTLLPLGGDQPSFSPRAPVSCSPSTSSITLQSEILPPQVKPSLTRRVSFTTTQPTNPVHPMHLVNPSSSSPVVSSSLHNSPGPSVSINLQPPFEQYSQNNHMLSHTPPSLVQTEIGLEALGAKDSTYGNDNTDVTNDPRLIALARDLARHPMCMPIYVPTVGKDKDYRYYKKSDVPVSALCYLQPPDTVTANMLLGWWASLTPEAIVRIRKEAVITPHKTY